MATPVRINELAPIINTNISVSMVLATDTVDETFKVSWGQLVDYLGESLIAPATNISFNGDNFVIYYPTVAPVPTNVQEAIDFNLEKTSKAVLIEGNQLIGGVKNFNDPRTTKLVANNAEDLTSKQYVDGKVSLTGDETINGQKTFTENPISTADQLLINDALTKRIYVHEQLDLKADPNTALKENTGWWKCGSTGVIYQWGLELDVSPSTPLNVVFPLPFASNARSVICGIRSNSSVNNTANAAGVVFDSFDIHNQTGTAHDVWWMAIGY